MFCEIMDLFQHSHLDELSAAGLLQQPSQIVSKPENR